MATHLVLVDWTDWEQSTHNGRSATAQAHKRAEPTRTSQAKRSKPDSELGHCQALWTPPQLVWLQAVTQKPERAQ